MLNPSKYLIFVFFQAAIRDSGNLVSKIAGMLDVEKKDLVDSLVTRVIAANNEVSIFKLKL
jgi:hypothetical protein